MFNNCPLRGGFVVRGRRTPAGPEVIVHSGNGHRAPLPLRTEWVNHSPTGFEWGYGGSGPAQLALAILGLVRPRRDAERLHHDYQTSVVVSLPWAQWEIPRRQIEEWLEARGERVPGRPREMPHA